MSELLDRFPPDPAWSPASRDAYVRAAKRIQAEVDECLAILARLASKPAQGVLFEQEAAR